MGVVQDLADQTRQWWAEKPARDAEWELWATVPDLAHLRELVAWFCEGKLSFTPGHAGPRCEETEGNVGEALAHANRSGFLTTNSQNGGQDQHRHEHPGLAQYGSQWRSCVEGLADDATVAKLRSLVAGTRLCLQAGPLRFFRQDGTVPGVHQKPDGTAYEGNPMLSWRDIAFQFAGILPEVLSQVTRLNYVQIVDPKWGPSDLLWERLSAPDWDDHSSAPRDATSPTTQGATDMNVADAYNSRWDRFFSWWDELWKWPQTPANGKPELVNSDRVTRKLAEQKGGQPGGEPGQTQPTPSQPPPKPKPPPQGRTRFQRPPVKKLNAWAGREHGWCSCEGNAHDTHCRAAASSKSRLNVNGRFLPPPGTGNRGASTEPAQPK